MLETFKAQLKAKARTLGANLSQRRIDAIADRLNKKFPDLTEEADIIQKVDEYHELQPLDELARQDDQLRTLEAASRNKGQDDKKQQDGTSQPQKDTSTGTDDTPAWAKALIQEVQTLKAEKQQQTISAKLQGHEKLKAVPGTFWQKRILPKSEEEIDAFVQEVETDFTAYEQERVNAGLSSSSRPVHGSGTTGKPSKEEVDAIVDTII